jgi:sulfane dehydrogenase subunit SoxC
VAPESVIVAPAPDSVLPLDRPTEIWGWAWSFRGVAAVEISVDGGASFSRATLEQRRGWAWQRFSLDWRPAAPGEALVSARAFDANGISQPPAGARNAMHTVRVVVRG